MQLNAKQVMGFIAFCSLEVNGTFLPTGIVSSHLRSKGSISYFKELVQSDGMYFTMLWSAMELGDKRHTPIYGSSCLPRHVGHNRSHSAGSVNTPAGFTAKSKKNLFKNGYHPTKCNESECDRLILHCSLVEKKLLDLCKDATHCVLRRSAKESGNMESDIGSLKGFLGEVQKIAGKGCSHIYSMDFFQLAGYLGFIPIKLLSTSSIRSYSAGGYKLIKSLYPGISIGDAQEYFEDSVERIQNLFGPSMTYPYAENLVCELHRDRNGESKNIKKDVTYFLPHRRNQFNGLQNFFRLAIKSGTQMDLEFLGVPPNTKSVTPGCTKLMCWKNGLTCSSGLMSWLHEELKENGNECTHQTSIKFDSVLIINDKIKQFYAHISSD